MTDDLDVGARCGECGRLSVVCVDDPLSPSGAIATVAAMIDGGGLPLDMVLDPSACVYGVLLSLASFMANVARAQPPGWLADVAQRMLRNTGQLDEPRSTP